MKVESNTLKRVEVQGEVTVTLTFDEVLVLYALTGLTYGSDGPEYDLFLAFVHLTEAAGVDCYGTQLGRWMITPISDRSATRPKAYE